MKIISPLMCTFAVLTALMLSSCSKKVDASNAKKNYSYFSDADGVFKVDFKSIEGSGIYKKFLSVANSDKSPLKDSFIQPKDIDVAIGAFSFDSGDKGMLDKASILIQVNNELSLDKLKKEFDDLEEVKVEGFDALKKKSLIGAFYVALVKDNTFDSVISLL